MTALKALVRKDLILYVSDRRALMLHLLMPVVLAAFFGSLFGGSGTSKTGKIDLGVVMLDQSNSGKKIVAGLKAEPTLRITELSAAEAQDKVRAGKLPVAVVIPAGFGAAADDALFGGRNKPELPVFYDPSQATVLAMVKGLLTQQVMRAASSAATDISVPYTLQEQALSGGPKYNGYAHSFAGMGVQFILFMGIEMGIGMLLARRLGIWNRLLAAPVSLSTVLLARALSGALIALGLMCSLFVFAALIFKVQVGSLVGFLGVALGFALVTAAFGLLIAAFGKTPEAARGIAVFATLIMVVLGGAWVPAFIFPEWMQTATLAIPTRWAVDGFDAVTWRGLGLAGALPSIAVLLGFAVLCGGVAIAKFSRDQRR